MVQRASYTRQVLAAGMVPAGRTVPFSKASMKDQKTVIRRTLTAVLFALLLLCPAGLDYGADPGEYNAALRA
jgi:hypothetical protein